eukprot:scaffold60268_cov27-Tisochrysis_lutea.AAC.8
MGPFANLQGHMPSLDPIFAGPTMELQPWKLLQTFPWFHIGRCRPDWPHHSVLTSAPRRAAVWDIQRSGYPGGLCRHRFLLGGVRGSLRFRENRGRPPSRGRPKMRDDVLVAPNTCARRAATSSCVEPAASPKSAARRVTTSPSAACSIDAGSACASCSCTYSATSRTVGWSKINVSDTLTEGKASESRVPNSTPASESSPASIRGTSSSTSWPRRSVASPRTLSTTASSAIRGSAAACPLKTANNLAKGSRAPMGAPPSCGAAGLAAIGGDAP